MTSFNTLHFGDVHLGLGTNPTPRIINNIIKTIHPLIAKGNIKILFLQGDLFDSIIFLNNPYLYEINVWIAEIISLCAKHGTEIVILEGTPRHDRRQSQQFVTIAEILNATRTVKYITDLSIHYHPSIKKYVLYIPDVCRDSADTVYNDVINLLEAQNLKQVDFAIVHGAFEYQLPIKDKHTHQQIRYEEIVKDFISVSHVHRYSRNGKIIAPGSFDCTEHGLKGPFGAIKIHHTETDFTVERVINKDPMPYLSFELSEDNAAWVEDEVKKALSKADLIYKINVSIKTVLNAENKAFYEYLKRTYLDVRWTLNPLVSEVKHNEKIIETVVMPSIDITPNNIFSMTKDKLIRMGAKDIDATLTILREYIDE